MDLRERAAGDRRHPWELARADVIRDLLRAHVELAGVATLLDVGAGDSWLAETLLDELAPAAQIVCWDAHYTDADLAAAPAGITRRRDAPDGHFPVVTALDVLEHVEDDRGFLADAIVRHLSVGGTLLATVPAHPALFSDHDRLLGHYRRYRPAELVGLVGDQLDVIASGSFFVSLLAPRWVEVGLERLGRHRGSTGAGQWRGGPTLTRMLRASLYADAAAGRALARRGLHLPGLSTWVVARRRP
jgi:hypothetical protein